MFAEHHEGRLLMLNTTAFVHEPVEYRGGHDGIAEDLTSVGEATVGRGDRGVAFFGLFASAVVGRSE